MDPRSAARPPAAPPPAAGQAGSLGATLRVVGTAGAGLLADGYDLAVVNIALAILGSLYPDDFDSSSKGLVASMTIVGVILGQVSFGTFADIVGRRAASIATAVLTIAGALLSACVTTTSGSFWSISLQLTLCRFMLGLGIGGEYPLSAAISKEIETEALCCTRAQLLVLNMLMFNIGVVVQAVIVLILLLAGTSLEVVWRVAMGCGAVPSTVAFILRWQMHEPELTDEHGEVTGRRGCRSYVHDLFEVLEARWPTLLGACVNWMLFNFVVYGQNTFSSIICDDMLGTSDDSTYYVVIKDAVFVLAMAFCSILGIFFGLWMESGVSLCSLQLLGFAGLAVTNWLDGSLLDVLPSSWAWLLVLFYCVNSMANAVVGITTYMVPSVNFPASARATCVGLAAASGKVGAAIGTGVFPTAEEKLGLGFVMIFNGFVLLVAVGVTWCLTPGSTPLKSRAKDS